MTRPRALILASPERTGVTACLERMHPVLAEHVTVAATLPADDAPLPDGTLDVELALAVGGDGTLINQARRLLPHGIPLIGVNVGRLGFLAEFDPDDLAEHAGTIFGPDPPVQDSMVLEVELRDATGAVVRRDVAVNDGVITAGPPFGVIELRLGVDGADGPIISGDGVIVATPTGSTAYNVSAGGPIVHPAVEAMVITPLAAHSLAFRPIVICSQCGLEIEVLKANAGTALIADGREPIPLAAGHVVSIRRHERKARFVLNPGQTYWKILQDKLRWAAPPKYRR